MLAITDMIRR